MVADFTLSLHVYIWIWLYTDELKYEIEHVYNWVAILIVCKNYTIFLVIVDS